MLSDPSSNVPSHITQPKRAIPSGAHLPPCELEIWMVPNLLRCQGHVETYTCLAPRWRERTKGLMRSKPHALFVTDGHHPRQQIQDFCRGVSSIVAEFYPP